MLARMSGMPGPRGTQAVSFFASSVHTGRPGVTTVPSFEQFASLRREMALATDAAGVVRWADERARDVLGVGPGMPLRERVSPGSEEKLARLIADPAGADEWELVMPVGGTPAAISFRAMPYADGLLLVASVRAPEHAHLVAQMSETMSELSTLQRERDRQAREIGRLTRDLDETDRGINALYDELSDKEQTLRNASEVKTRFVADMSHELRTPVNSIIGLTQLLLNRTDGELAPEQEKQISFIRKSAEALSELVNDLLDLSKMEAGRMRLRSARFEADALFSSLRGMMRPLLTNPDVRLVFEEPRGLPAFDTDEGKIAQILRNLVSNALKFTEEGEVRVLAAANADGTATFAVRDTGIGIDPRDHARIFEEFAQIENDLQRRVKGTGLGLTVSRHLAGLLGGRLEVESAPGRGSTFRLTIPAVHPDAAELQDMEERSQHLDSTKSPVLVVEDDTTTLLLYEKYLEGSGFQVLPARSVEEARRTLERIRPAAVVLDVMLDGETSWNFLNELKLNPETRDIPALVVTVVDRERKARALGADEFFVKPLDKDWLLKRLRTIAAPGPVERVLIIDDDEVSRYVVRRLLAGTRYKLIEAVDGPDGVQKAREHVPDVIILDFVMPAMTAFDVLDELKCDPKTRGIPVILSTSKHLNDNERERLQTETAAIMTKDKLSREVAIARIREALAKAVSGIAPAHGGHAPAAPPGVPRG
jgi:signal transduction histidine kinase/CheY-like chemotaxis protein